MIEPEWSWCESRGCDVWIWSHGDWCVGVDRVAPFDTVVRVSVWNQQDLMPVQLQPDVYTVCTSLSHVTRLCDMIQQDSCTCSPDALQ